VVAAWNTPQLLFWFCFLNLFVSWPNTMIGLDPVKEIDPLVKAVANVFTKAEVDLGLDRKQTLPLKQRIERLLKEAMVSKGLDPGLYRNVWLMKDTAARLPDVVLPTIEDDNPTTNNNTDAFHSHSPEQSANIPATNQEFSEPEVNDVTMLPAPWWEDGKPRPGLSFTERLKQLIKPKKPDPVERWGADWMGN
jgi:hypothetical protein